MIRDCLSNLAFELPPVWFREISYNIGSGAKTMQYGLPIDSISIQTATPEFCGPVKYQVYNATDEKGTKIQDLSPFVRFDQSKNVLTVKTENIKIAGSYYLMFEIYLENYAGIATYPRKQAIVKLNLVDTTPEFAIEVETEPEQEVEESPFVTLVTDDATTEVETEVKVTTEDTKAEETPIDNKEAALTLVDDDSSPEEVEEMV